MIEAEELDSKYFDRKLSKSSEIEGTLQKINICHKKGWIENTNYSNVYGQKRKYFLT